VEFEAESDCVIVCTGGFGANVDMIKEHLGYNHGEDLFSFRIPGLEGEGMRMVWEIGGGRSPVNIEMTYEAPGFPGGTLADAIFRQPNLMVNLNGVRFINEEIMCNTPFTGNAINIQKGRFGISVVSDELLDSYLGKGLDFVGYHKDAICYIDNWRNVFDEIFSGVDVRTEDKEAAGAMMGIKDPTARFFFQANSLEDLAEQAGIDKKNFLKTVEEYNAACEGRGDDFFGKNIRYMRPIREKKFYAMKFGPSGYGSLGGIMVNDFLQVLTDAGDPILGLYSAGTDCCGIFGDTYDFYLPGSTMGFAINSGRMAGMNAVDYIDSSNFVE
jgi:fumarate reductase flavoprotein subunit